MPFKHEFSTDYTSGGTRINRGIIRRLNPIIFLSICCGLVVLAIVAALIVFTFLPIFTSTKGNHTKYQVQSAVLNLVYNLPDRLSILPMNWTYVTEELDLDKIYILQNLLQVKLSNTKISKKTSLTIMEAYVQRQDSPTSLPVISPVILDNNNNTVIIITQSDSNTDRNSTAQLIISLILRYALDCSQKCQNNLKASIFAKTFHSLEVPVNTFETLFIKELQTSTNQIPTEFSTSTTKSTTLIPCIISSPSSILSSSIIMAISYEAESSLNAFISTTIQPCFVCSGGKKVGNIGFINELIFQQIKSQYGGRTTIIFHYITDRIRSAEIVINDLFPSVHVTFPIMSPNQNIATLPIILNLCQGFNSIRIYNRNDYTPEFDRIVIY